LAFLAHQLAQRLLPDHREHHRPDRVVRAGNSGLGEPEQDRFLATHPPQILGQLTLDPAVGPRVDPMDQSDQQLDQRNGDLRRPQPAQPRQQRQPHRTRCGPRIRRVRPRSSGPPRLDQFLARVGEQADR
jgi:hypothetical protein